MSKIRDSADMRKLRPLIMDTTGLPVRQHDGLPKEVEQLDLITGEVISEFPSVAKANESIGKAKDNSQISKACRGERKLAHGFKWRYKI